MITAMAVHDTAIQLARAAQVAGSGGPSEPPAAIVDWLARLRLLEGVPFSYLVPDARLLPQESIRFFYLNRDWTDAAVDGAVSLGGVTTRDRSALHAAYAELRAAVDTAERRLWARRLGQPEPDGPAEVVTGFLLRSRAVSGWPGLHVHAYRDGSATPLRLLRLERLAPAVLLVLFDGVPDRVDVEEPRQGLQFGVDLVADRSKVKVRTPATGEETGEKVDVPFRSGAPGVIDVTTLRDRLSQTPAAGADTSLSPAEFAQQMLQFPYRQEFGAPSESPPPSGSVQEAPVFVPTVAMERVRLSYRLEAR